jgi:DNA-binding transcriptional LysR family regulator
VFLGHTWRGAAFGSKLYYYYRTSCGRTEDTRVTQGGTTMLQHLETDLLRAFVVVAETNSFTKASERLFRTQAAISMQIKRLEERIGKPIFVRSAQGTRLTTEGELLIDYARRILHLNDEAFANLGVPRPEEGLVRLGTPDDYATILLPDVLLTFNKAFPEVQVEVTCENGVNLVRELREGHLDLALVTRRPDTKEGELIRREPLHWITSTDKSPHTSDPLPLALFPNGCVCRDLALRALKETNRRWKVVFASGTIAPILAAVSAGVAVSIAEESVIPPGARRLGAADGFPSLGTVDIVLHRAAGPLSRPTAMLAEHIGLSLKRQGRATRTGAVAPPGQLRAVVARSAHMNGSPKSDGEESVPDAGAVSLGRASLRTNVEARGSSRTAR